MGPRDKDGIESRMFGEDAVEAAEGVASEVAGRIEIEGERGRHRDDKRVKDVLEFLWREQAEAEGPSGEMEALARKVEDAIRDWGDEENVTVL